MSKHTHTPEPWQALDETVIGPGCENALRQAEAAIAKATD